jgi:hypothetical protein
MDKAFSLPLLLPYFECDTCDKIMVSMAYAKKITCDKLFQSHIEK